ncbi:PPC domain-containing protein [Corallococcus macrosporus]|uniref:PPC domain-containing protein n=1 Tax=Corallococcus macrosporus TaxID=35 RepID=A0ABS3DPS0_9BACT|nr:PPC domain-containing protein [Corallococcus macrosporus]MBN8233322.1 PPC domain-containing protein [Corallococcus macrosporus]
MKRLAWKAFAAAWLTCALTGCGAEMEQGPEAEKGPPPEEQVQALASCTGNIALTPNVAVTGISANAGEWSCTYTLYVASANSNLTFTTTGGSGDADLYVKYGAEPTSGVNDCVSNGGSNAESCSITGSQVGTYYVKVYGYAAFSGLSLKATSTPSGPTGCTSSTTLTKDVPLSGISADAGNWSCIYKLYVPTGATTVTFNTTGGSGNADLFVRREGSPTETVYDCKSASYYGTNQETCSLPVSSSGIYWARLYGTGSFSNASITGTYTLSGGQPGCTTTSPLGNNTPTYGLSAPPGGFSCDYTLEVPTGATKVTFSTSGGSGATAHLYAKRGSAPTLSSYDCVGASGGAVNNNQTCYVDNPTAGTWHVRVYNASSSGTLANASLRGVYVTGGTNPNPPTGVLTLGQTVTGLSGAQGSVRYWSINVTDTSKFLTVRTSGGTGDADVYVKEAIRPDTTSYDCKSGNGGTTETCQTYVLRTGTYYVMMHGYAAYSGVSITATLEN